MITPKELFLKDLSVFLSKIIKKIKHNKKYTAAYLAKNANPKNTPNRKKLNIFPDSLISISSVIDIVQNNNSTKSVETKNEETLAAGMTKKLIAHIIDLSRDIKSFKQKL